MKKSSLKVAIAIMIIPLCSMITSSITIILGGIMQSFPERSVQSIQLIYSVISGVGIIGSFLAGKFASFTTKRISIIIFSFVNVAGAMLAYFGYTSYYALLAASVIIGTATSTVRPLSISLIAEHFEGMERARLTGLQALAVNGGGSLISFTVGIITKNYWRNAYLIFLIMIPIALVALFMLPKGSVEKSETSEKTKVMTPALGKLMIESFVFGMGLLTFMGNVSVCSISVEQPRLASYSKCIYMIVLCIVGIFIPRIMKLFKQKTMLAGLVFAALGLLCLGFKTSPALIIMCAVLFGIGFGIYFPSAYATIPGMVKPTSITMAISYFSIAMSIGCLLNPYIVTSGATLINDSINTRYLLASILIAAVIIILEVILKPKKENN